jgi:hypothetical protein
VRPAVVSIDGRTSERRPGGHNSDRHDRPGPARYAHRQAANVMFRVRAAFRRGGTPEQGRQMNSLVRAAIDGFRIEIIPAENACELRVSKGARSVARMIDLVSVVATQTGCLDAQVNLLRQLLETRDELKVFCPHCRGRIPSGTLCPRCLLDSRDAVSYENPPLRPIGATWQFDKGFWKLACGPDAFDDPDV